MTDDYFFTCTTISSFDFFSATCTSNASITTTMQKYSTIIYNNSNKSIINSLPIENKFFIANFVLFHLNIKKSHARIDIEKYYWSISFWKENW
jgi:hypothetical protein